MTTGNTESKASKTVTVTQFAVRVLSLTSDAVVTLGHDVTYEQTITFNLGGGATRWESSINLNPI